MSVSCSIVDWRFVQRSEVAAVRMSGSTWHGGKPAVVQDLHFSCN